MGVGGSLGGLATGLALKALGHNTTILERNPKPLLQDQGAGIVAGGDTLDFFERYNRCNRPLAVTSYARQYLNREGNIVHKEEMLQSMTSWDLTYYLMRANYDGVESPYCEVPDPAPGHGTAVHIHDRNVTEIREEPSGDSQDKPGRTGGGVRVFWKSSQGDEGSILADIVNENTLDTARCAGPSRKMRQARKPGRHVASGSPSSIAPASRSLHTSFRAKDGTVEPGKRLLNFVYYTNFPEGSDELEEIMTDCNGRRRAITMPPGMTDPNAWEKQRKLARERLPPQFAEIVCGTNKPFVQAVTDVLSPEHEYWGGKVVLIGDALAGFRPHTVASTSQAAFDAMIFADYIDGKVSREEWKRQTLGFARYIQKRGVDMGEHSQHMDLPLEDHIHDRNVASTPRQEEVYPDWATAFSG
ncbi:hypothetical protein ONZ43_g4764 [Nemania bipapillata]|uniref:Uncharacterized protein n=1 Tax=Nemania bipapillata TaxID=110536 RepID=A0ACC2IIQ9_9PEZI|nr:hypothetical protein ONZ43_g4764 [Nemania bipapillata]